MSRGPEKLQGVGYIALALGFGIAGLRLLRGDDGDAAPLRGIGDVPKQLKQVDHDVSHIDDRVKLLHKMLRRAATSGTVHEIATEILSQKSGGKYLVAEKDCWGEVKFLFDAIRKPSSKYALRYTRDSVLADIFSEAERTLLKTHGADCDDYVVCLGGLLMAVGHPIKIRVIQTEGETSWNHVYFTTPRNWDGDEPWAAVDCSMDKPLGWEAPGAAECARTGKPAGITLRVKDYDVQEELRSRDLKELRK